MSSVTRCCVLLVLVANVVGCSKAKAPSEAPIVDTGAAAWLKTSAGGGPRTGEIFTELVMVAPHRRGHEIIAGRTNENPADASYKNLSFQTSVFDLRKVKRVEVRVELSTGRPGTKVRKISFNNNGAIVLPDNPLPSAHAAQPAGAPGDYGALVYSTAEVPLSTLRNGINDVSFDCEGGKEPLFRWWNLTFRFYMKASESGPQARLASPQPGALLGDKAEFQIEAKSPNGAIAKVEYFGFYEDFNYAGDGVNEGWQFRTERGEYRDHVGTATAAPWKVTWDTRWIPDQRKSMQFAAIVTDVRGFSTLTRVVEGVGLARRKHSVRLYKATDIPARYTAFTGEPKSNTLEPIGEDISRAKVARLRVVTFNGFGAKSVSMNQTVLRDKLGALLFTRDLTELNVPVTALKGGVNRVTIEGAAGPTQAGVEVMYPGAELKVAYELPYSGLAVNAANTPEKAR